MTGRAIAPALLWLALVATGCLTPEPALEQRSYAPVGTALERVAVAPFYLHQIYDDSNRMGSVSLVSAGERVTRHIAEALGERGVDVLPEVDVAAAIGGFETKSPAIDAIFLAEIVGHELGATGVIVGEVLRFREPRGATSSNRKPASVAYQLTLYEAPSGFKLRTLRFDETQTVPDAARGSGRGYGDEETRVRFKSADEIARWGADAVADALVDDF